MPANDSIRSPLDRAVPSDTTTAVVALGYLWGADPVFGGRDGVVRTCVGFAGGTTPDPTHSAIGDHVEAVRVVFAPDQLSYRELLNHFWAHHDPAQAPALLDARSTSSYRTAVAIRASPGRRRGAAGQPFGSGTARAFLGASSFDASNGRRYEMLSTVALLRSVSPMPMSFEYAYPSN